MVTMPEWQGAGVGMRFLEWVCENNLQGGGRKGKKFQRISIHLILSFVRL